MRTTQHVPNVQTLNQNSNMLRQLDAERTKETDDSDRLKESASVELATNMPA
ncbi:hypothetical protein PF005_g23510 [Phytophthora fragariae]|uniref:Uncharacterized protein n=1 Tax=Phytophthora fragariae TaxID=53985 RepID=A0A6A3JN26_9STRA|nr:hypothetical protein PF009_g11799 [Phytophthora fragariae]KAE8996646.1 hypothetical protein PF011_g15814 [Phytophthora fragariae]KAE9083264.1 hypothetical protein PF010_g21282 [Phytophthora fragariae]KAE9113207.1 hypothetical protein PF006_g19803 [Phytophthora fragariae]KAE9128141.1 hypothetical protein PF007_g5375 [Phytophthora fragariae]